jgi:23S rRNA (adenine2503-C2)-methyltransferase
MKPSIFQFGRAGLASYLAEIGEPAYRAVQILTWVYGRGVADPAAMTDLGKPLRAKLNEALDFTPPAVDTVQQSADGTRKLLFKLGDGEKIEAVMIPDDDRDRKTLCMSTQVGCAMGCRFCYTARGGLKRNMTAGEIAWQFSAIERELSAEAGKDERALTNVVFMGMGEPLQNLDNLVDAIEIMTADWGFNFSPKRITVSTVGIIPNLVPLLERTNAQLAISLHASTPAQRAEIVPMEKKYPMLELLAACRALDLPKRRRITFEYVVLAGVNDAPDDAARLAKLLRDIPAKVNLIPFNEFPGAPYRAPAHATVLAFQARLQAAGYDVFIRRRRGEDILAACGQLRGEIEPARMPKWAREELQAHDDRSAH